MDMFKHWRRTSPGEAGESGSPEPVAEKGYSTQGSYGLKKCYDNAEASADILFVHGLTGNRETTWTDKSGVFWPEALLKEDIPKARILTFGYDADVVHFWAMASQNRIGNHAQNLVNALAQLRGKTDTSERPLLFVVHSLGGLVVEDTLLASKNSAELHIRQILECTTAIAFLGTPHCGSDLARWAKMFGNFTAIFKSTNTNLPSVLQPNSEVLARIQQEFHTMLRARRDAGKGEVNITCFYEELPVRGVGEIVPMHSAILPAYNYIGIRANHMDMPKVSSSEEPGYLAISGELRRWVKAVPTASTTPQSMMQGQYGQSFSSAVQGSAFNTPQNSGYMYPPDHGQAREGYNSQFPWPYHVLPGQHPSPFYPSNAQNYVYPHGSPTPQQQPQPQPQPLQLEYGHRLYQGGNVIEGQTTISGSGKAVQGNNISSERDVTFNL